MIKRPKLIYVIAVWTLFQLPFAITVPLRSVKQILGFAPTVPHELSGLLMLAGIVVLVGLVQMRSVPRIITIVFLSMATFVCCWLFAQITVFGLTANYGITNPIRMGVQCLASIIVNVLIIWYIGRKKFAVLCQQFRTQVFKNRTEIDLAQANKEFKKNFIWPK